MAFFLETLLGGLMAGMLYSLVALGFVLIYKASGVFNFAQGAMVFFAVLSFVGFMELGLNFWAALPVTVALMVVVGVVMDLSDRVVVLDYGKKIGDGPPDEVRSNPEVIKAYLGVAD